MYAVSCRLSWAFLGFLNHLTLSLFSDSRLDEEKCSKQHQGPDRLAACHPHPTAFLFTQVT